MYDISIQKHPEVAGFGQRGEAADRSKEHNGKKQENGRVLWGIQLIVVVVVTVDQLLQLLRELLAGDVLLAEVGARLVADMRDAVVVLLIALTPDHRDGSVEKRNMQRMRRTVLLCRTAS